MTAAPIKVLVIDDEPPIRKLLRMGLSTQGYHVLEAYNGKLALEMLDCGALLSRGRAKSTRGLPVSQAPAGGSRSRSQS